jgi:hypothetical protein
MADNTASLVVALSAQLTKFERDMRQAGIIADNAVRGIEDKFSKMNPQVSASFLGNFLSNLASKGFDAAIKAINDFIDGFVRLEKAARLAEVPVSKMFGISAGLGKDMAANARAAEQLTTMLDQMRRGEETSFGKLKEANPDFFKDMGKDTFDVAENVARVADMVKQAGSEVEKWKIAEQAGFTRDMIKELEKGGDHFRKIAAGAAATGGQIAAAAAEAKVLREAMLSVWDNFVKQAQEDFWKDNAMFVRLGIQGLELMKNSARSWGGETAASAKEVKDALKPEGGDTFLDRWSAQLQKVQSDMKKAGEEAAKLEGKATGKGTSTADPDKPLAHPAPAGRGGGGQADAFVTASEQIIKHTAVVEADSAAVGLNAGEQERLRVEAILTTAAMKQYGEISGETAEKIKQLSEAAGAAKLRNAELAGQLQKINAASQQFGQALSTAFADAIVDGKKLNEVLSQLLKTIARAIIQSSVMSFFTPAAGQQTSLFGSLFSGGGGTPLGMGGIGRAQRGTDFAPGGLMMVGEKGPELLNLPRGSQVIPNDILRANAGSSGDAIVYSPAIDARGASVEAVARLAQIMEQDRATFELRTVTAIRRARLHRIPL